MEISKNWGGGTLKWLVYNGNSIYKWMIGGTPILGNLHIAKTSYSSWWTTPWRSRPHLEAAWIVVPAMFPSGRYPEGEVGGCWGDYGFTYWCLAGNGWERGNGIIINSYYGSFPHSRSEALVGIDHSPIPAFSTSFLTGLLSMKFGYFIYVNSKFSGASCIIRKMVMMMIMMMVDDGGGGGGGGGGCDGDGDCDDGDGDGDGDGAFEPLCRWYPIFLRVKVGFYVWKLDCIFISPDDHHSINRLSHAHGMYRYLWIPW